MKNKAQKQLPFEPLYHRKISQGTYTPIALKSLRVPKGAEAISSKDIAKERQSILAEGFVICESNEELSRARIETADKGDVASVIANSNPLFRLHNA